MWASQTAGKRAVQAQRAVQLQQRHERHLVGHDEQADDDDEHEVPPGHSMKVNAYAAKAAIRIGMTVAGSAT